MVRVLFVCLGNICRSPLGEGIFRHLVTEAGLAHAFEIDSAGTGNWHVGAPPHEGSRRAAHARGVSLEGQAARQIRPRDLAHYDYVLAMDSQNYADIQTLDPEARCSARLHRMLEFAPDCGLVDVPDPYFGGPADFDHAFDLIEGACRTLLEQICREHGLEPTKI